MDQDATQSTENGGDGWGADSNEQATFGGSPANDGDGKFSESLAEKLTFVTDSNPYLHQMVGEARKLLALGLQSQPKQSLLMIPFLQQHR